MAQRICPWWFGYFLLFPLRRWFHDPSKIIGQYLAEGMTVLEPGPGMGFFTLEIARHVGPNGRVIAIDVQAKMLSRLMNRAAKARLAERIDARLLKGDQLGLDEFVGRVDFALAFAMVHEVPNPAALFAEMHRALKPGAKLFFGEPAGHVRAEDFDANLANASRAGFQIESRPSIRHSHGAVLVRSQV
jgi:ubiquinone/menaquinone biosynthesis C-methylase UbiE